MSSGVRNTERRVQVRTSERRDRQGYERPEIEVLPARVHAQRLRLVLHDRPRLDRQQIAPIHQEPLRKQHEVGEAPERAVISTPSMLPSGFASSVVTRNSAKVPAGHRTYSAARYLRSADSCRPALSSTLVTPATSVATRVPAEAAVPAGTQGATIGVSGYQEARNG